MLNINTRAVQCAHYAYIDLYQLATLSTDRVFNISAEGYTVCLS